MQRVRLLLRLTYGPLKGRFIIGRKSHTSAARAQPPCYPDLWCSGIGSSSHPRCCWPSCRSAANASAPTMSPAGSPRRRLTHCRPRPSSCPSKAKTKDYARISPRWLRSIIPDYELMVVAHSAEDIPPGVLPARAKVVLAHGDDPNTGEKVQNLQAAVRAARRQSDILAFADSDGRPSSRLAAGAGGAARRAGRRRIHRLPLVHPRAADVLDAHARRMGRGRRGTARAGRQSVRLGRRDGDPQRRVRGRARRRVLEKYGFGRLRAGGGGARRRA